MAESGPARREGGERREGGSGASGHALRSLIWFMVRLRPYFYSKGLFTA